MLAPLRASSATCWRRFLERFLHHHAGARDLAKNRLIKRRPAGLWGTRERVGLQMSTGRRCAGWMRRGRLRSLCERTAGIFRGLGVITALEMVSGRGRANGQASERVSQQPANRVRRFELRSGITGVIGSMQGLTAKNSMWIVGVPAPCTSTRPSATRRTRARITTSRVEGQRCLDHRAPHRPWRAAIIQGFVAPTLGQCQGRIAST